MSNFDNLHMNVIRWAEARKIIPNAKPEAQLLKTMSELGELADAVLKRDREGTIDGFGDVLVTLMLAAALLDLDIVKCLESAYNEIKDRRGILNDQGAFIKE